MQQPNKRGGGRTDRAKRFLCEILADGPVLRKIVVKRGAAEGLSAMQLQYALKHVGALSYRPRGTLAFWYLMQHLPPEDITPEDCH